jgi:hypothetical protein
VHRDTPRNHSCRRGPTAASPNCGAGNSGSVAGGAGYVQRLFEDPDFSAKALVNAAIRVVDCRRPDCATSCSQCINDYSNQAYWDVFDRLPVLAWLPRTSFGRDPAAIPCAGTGNSGQGNQLFRAERAIKRSFSAYAFCRFGSGRSRIRSSRPGI